MTTNLIYRFRCDAPRCWAETLGSGDGRDTPEGWTVLSSTAHIRPDDFPRPPIKTARGRTRQNRLTYETAVAGRFTLHLCPEHPEAFVDHKPRTDGNGGGGRDGTPVSVSCSCGVRAPWVHAVTFVGGEKPRYAPERQWWQHLPADLQWYARREAVADHVA